MGTSVAMIDRTYGHLARDSEAGDPGAARRASRTTGVDMASDGEAEPAANAATG